MNPNLDLYSLEAERTAEEKAVISLVRRFVESEVLPIIRESHVKGEFPKQLIPGFQKLGILEPLANGELDPLHYGLAMRELERAGSAMRSFISVQGSLAMKAIRDYGSDGLKKKWLGPMGKLEAIGCFGLTEPDFGSNPSGMRTRAEKTANGFKLSGSKTWITNGTLAQVAVIWARFEDKIRGFVVETDRPGFESRSISGKWSFRASDTAELFLDGVEIPEENLLEGSRSLGSALKCLNDARYGIAWGVTGAAGFCLEEARSYLVERKQFDDKPLASHQLIQSKLAWMAADLTAMQLLVEQLAVLKRVGKVEPHQVSLAKMYNCRKALEVARVCRELLGAAGIHDEHHVGHHLVDLETVVTYEGTEHIHSLILGEKLTGIAAYS